MFAPKVSKKYWEDLVIRYNQHLKEEKNDDEKLLYNLLESSITNDIKESLDLLVKQKEYDKCLLLYVKNMINKSIKIKGNNENNIIYFLEESYDEEKINNLINQINKDKKGENYLELMRIINLSVKDKLSENKIIESACIFLSVNQITLTIKLLISLTEYELAFYLMDISKDKLYEDVIYINLLKHSIKMNNYKNHIHLINACQNKQIKMRMYKLLLNKNFKLESKDKKDYEELLNEAKNDIKDKDINLFLNLNNNIKVFLPEIINKYYNILLTQLSDEKLEIKTLIEINELFNELRIYDFNIELKNSDKESVMKKIILIIIVIETLNKNCVSVKLLINRFLKLSNKENINDLDENEKMIISLGNYFYKSIKNESLFNVNFNLNLTLRHNINYEKIRDDFNNKIKESNDNDIDILNRFSCDLYNKFYLHSSNIKNEILEVNKYIQIINDINIE